MVDHGGVRTTYEPVRRRVDVGDPVARGQQIGTLQRLLSHCFPRACLHWGLLRGETYLDPLTLVGRRARPAAAPLPAGMPVVPLVVRPAGGPAGRPGAADPW